MRRTFTTLLVGSAAIFAGGTAGAAVVISTAPTSNMSCVSGVCTPTAKNAVLNTGDLVGMLAAGDLTVKSDALSADIQVKSAVGWAAANRLTLDSEHAIAVGSPLSVTGTGALTLTTNDGGTGGDLTFSGPGHAEFWDLSSSLIVNGTSYTLVGDLATLSADATGNPSGAFALAKSYDASVDGIYAQCPVELTFAGKFEGLGNAISKLSIAISGEWLQVNAGLFRKLDTGAVVRDVNMTGIHIAVDARNHSSSSGVGAIAGESQGEIDNVTANGHMKVRVNFPGGIGGIVGTVDAGSINNAHADVSINARGTRGSVYAGGLVGTMQAGVIQNSSATGSVAAFAHKKSGSAVAGGLVGGGNVAIAMSWASGAVKATGGGSAYAGGLIGVLDSGYVVASYSLGNAGVVKAANVVMSGGFVGQTDIGNVSSSYSTGSVSAPHAFYGGFVGFNSATCSADYWDTDTSGRSEGNGGGDGSGISGLTDAQLKSALPAGFDPATWGRSAGVNNGYPYLLGNLPP